jgi:3-oxoacyl-[acyl-carrier-protein] synthase-3
MLADDRCLVNEIKAIICVTFTPDRPMPANAIAAQYRLGLDTSCLAFDVNLACSGYGYGLWLASTIAKQTMGKVLLLDGDVQSAFVSPFDKGTVPVLSDAGTASIIAPTDDVCHWYFTFFTDGSKRDILTIPAGGSNSPVTVADLEYQDMPDGSRRRRVDIAMDGFGIFKFVAQTVSQLLRNFISETGMTPDEIQAFVPHQANIYMIKQLAKKIGINPDRVWVSGDKFGNSASATIPVTIASEGPRRLTNNGPVRLLLSGFGAGLSVSAGLIMIDATTKFGLLIFEKE